MGPPLLVMSCSRQKNRRRKGERRDNNHKPQLQDNFLRIEVRPREPTVWGYLKRTSRVADRTKWQQKEAKNSKKNGKGSRRTRGKRRSSRCVHAPRLLVLIFVSQTDSDKKKQNEKKTTFPNKKKNWCPPRQPDNCRGGGEGGWKGALSSRRSKQARHCDNATPTQKGPQKTRQRSENKARSLKGSKLLADFPKAQT